MLSDVWGLKGVIVSALDIFNLTPSRSARVSNIEVFYLHRNWNFNVKNQMNASLATKIFSSFELSSFPIVFVS